MTVVNVAATMVWMCYIVQFLPGVQAYYPSPLLTFLNYSSDLYSSLIIFFLDQMWKCRGWKRQLSHWWQPMKRRYICWVVIQFLSVKVFQLTRMLVFSLCIQILPLKDRKIEELKQSLLRYKKVQEMVMSVQGKKGETIEFNVCLFFTST